MRHKSIDTLILLLNLLFVSYLFFDESLWDLINHTSIKVQKDITYLQSAEYFQDYKSIIYPFKLGMAAVISACSLAVILYTLLNWKSGRNLLLGKINAFLSGLLLLFFTSALLAPNPLAYVG